MRGDAPEDSNSLWPLAMLRRYQVTILTCTLTHRYACLRPKRPWRASCRPEIFITDQGSRFTNAAFAGTLAATGVRISRDGRQRWMD